MKNPPNVILVVLDTMRLDVLYDNMNNLPGLSMLSETSSIFKNAFSPSTWTIPSHASMFTGMYSAEHGMHNWYDNDKFLESISKFPARSKPLAHLMRENGFNTYSYSTNTNLGAGTAFAYGFDQAQSVGPFIVREKHKPQMMAVLGEDEIGGHGSITKGKTKLEFLREIGPAKALKLFNLNRKWRSELREHDFPRKKGASEVLDAFKDTNVEEPYFVFFNLMEAHEPYYKTMDFSTLVRYYARGSLTKQWQDRAKMDAELLKIRKVLQSDVEHLDLFFQGLIQYLKSKGLYDDTVIVVVSDHGQCFGEDDFVGHGYLLNDYLSHVPMTIKTPGSKRSVVEDYVSILDLYSYIGSLLSENNPEFPVRDYIYCESFGFADFGWKKFLGPISEQFKPEVRKRIWDKNGYSISVNGTHGTIEYLTHNGNKLKIEDNSEIKLELLSELGIFTGSQNFLLPDI